MGWQDQPIATARDVLAGEWRHAWPAPLVRWLRERSPGLALDWVFRIVPQLLPRTGSPHAGALVAEVDELQGWRAAPPPSATFRERCDRLWYHPDRDPAQTAVSHLCMDLAQATCPDMAIGVNWLWGVPSLLCSEGFGGVPRAELVEWSIADFEAFHSSGPNPALQQTAASAAIRDPQPVARPLLRFMFGLGEH